MKKIFSFIFYFLALSTITLVPTTRVVDSIEKQNVEQQVAYSDSIDMWYVSERVADYDAETIDVEITFYLVEDISEAIYYTIRTSESDEQYWVPDANTKIITQYSSGLEAGVYSFWIYDISVPYDSLYTAYDAYYVYIDLWVGDLLVPHYGYSIKVNQIDGSDLTIQYEMSLASSSFHLRGWSYSTNDDYFVIELAALGDYGDYNGKNGGSVHKVYDVYEPNYGKTLNEYTGMPANGSYATKQFTYRQTEDDFQILYGEQSSIHFSLGWVDPNGGIGSLPYTMTNHILSFCYTDQVNQLAIDNVRVETINSDSVKITYDQNFESEDLWVYFGTDNTPSNAEWDLVTSSSSNYQGITNGAMDNKTYTVDGLIQGQTYYVQFAYGGKDSNFNGNEIVQMSQESFTFSVTNPTTTISSSSASNITTTSAQIDYTFNLGQDWTTGWTVEYILYKDSISVSNKVKEEDVTPTNLYNQNQSFSITGLEPETNYILELYINGTKVNGRDVSFTTISEAAVIGKPNEDAEKPSQSGESLYLTYSLAEDVTTLEYSFIEQGSTTTTWVNVQQPQYKTAGSHTVVLSLEGLTVGQTYTLATKIDSVEQETTYSFEMQDPSSTLPPDGGQTGGSTSVEGGNLMLILGITLGAVAGIIVLSGIGYFVFNRKKK